jgi:ubiquinone/menaquinone biosynthesis C-methylase UbiE/pimeloyl-ACP methyl ester carboxylesterase
VIEFENAEGQTLKAIIDAAGSTPGAPVVLMPPAFVKTKETLLPLARTIVESFRRAGERITVVRLDGINRRGESYKDPSCRQPGRECYRFTYSQGVRDIQASLDFLESSPAFQPSTVILVTFSSAAIEARRALALESRARIGGWVSVVGAADLASGWRVLNGGVDYLAGCERGVRFSIQPVLGVEGDVDHTARDAIASGLAYMEDARRDMAKIQVPILWLLGRDDGWIDAERAQELMACGDARDRRLIEVPTGHQLRTSREALDCFQLIAQEVATMVLSRPIEPTAPSVEDLLRRREAERSRLPRVDVDLPGFWKDYLLGREDRLGMELLTGTRVYRELMHAQVSGLDLRPGDRVADLGSGTGAFVRELLERDDVPPGLEVHQVDYVREALGRTRSRLGQLASEGKIALRFVACELGGASNVPLRSGSHHAILASLLINYVPDPHALLTECHRLLPSGGRLVLSALRPDPDISQILLSAIREVRSGAFELEAEESASSLERSLRGFLNDVARLVELEEAGVFQCWEADQLAGMVERSGFAVLDCQTSFGDPPQAIVLKAVKR